MTVLCIFDCNYSVGLRIYCADRKKTFSTLTVTFDLEKLRRIIKFCGAFCICLLFRYSFIPAAYAAV